MRERGATTSLVGAASVTGALVTWLALLLCARLLGPEGYSRFLAVWSVFFASTGTLAGLQQEVTRRVARSAPESAGAGDDPPRQPGRSLWAGSLLVGAVGALLFLLGSPFWGPEVWGPGWPTLLPVVALGLVGYGWANGVTGALAGVGAWPWYSATMALEGVLRSLVMVAAVLVTDSRAGWQVALLSGLAAWVLLAGVSSEVRATRHHRLDSTSAFLTDSARAVLAAGCSALALAGFPALVLATDRGDSGAAVGVALAVVVNARAPLLFLGSFQGPLIRWLSHGGSPTPRAAAVAVVATGAGALAGHLLGPAVLAAVFGAAFTTSGPFVAGVVVGVALTAATTLSGWAALVAGRHTAYMVGWGAVLVVMIGCLALPVGLEARVVVALVLGPAAGMACHLAGAGAPRGPARVGAASLRR